MLSRNDIKATFSWFKLTQIRTNQHKGLRHLVSLINRCQSMIAPLYDPTKWHKLSYQSNSCDQIVGIFKANNSKTISIKHNVQSKQ